MFLLLVHAFTIKLLLHETENLNINVTHYMK